jgi:enamine deaminase RidA (YjgF/YER057c/UK114 family)
MTPAEFGERTEKAAGVICMPDITRRDLAGISAGAAIAGGTSWSGVASAANSLEQGASQGKNMSIERHLIQQPTSGAPLIRVTPIISFAAAHENIVYLAGITADPAHLGDVKDQTRQVLERIDRLLARAGSDKSKLLSAQIWLTDMANFEAHNAAWNAWVDPKNPPVRACLHSPQLWLPGLLVEIMVTATK